MFIIKIYIHDKINYCVTCKTSAFSLFEVIKIETNQKKTLVIVNR